MRKNHQPEQCPYCKGQGYFQLILGGSENCPHCDGEGVHDPHQAELAGNK